MSHLEGMSNDLVFRGLGWADERPCAQEGGVVGLTRRRPEVSIGGPFPAKGTTADAHPQPTPIPGHAPGRVRPLLHPAVVSDLPSAGGWVFGPAGPAHRHRDAGRRRAGRPPPPRPGLPVLR